MRSSLPTLSRERPRTVAIACKNTSRQASISPYSSRWGHRWRGRELSSWPETSRTIQDENLRTHGRLPYRLNFPPSRKRILRFQPKGFALKKGRDPTLNLLTERKQVIAREKYHHEKHEGHKVKSHCKILRDLRVLRDRPRTTDLRPWLWGAALTGRSKHSPPRLRARRSVVRGKELTPD